MRSLEGKSVSDDDQLVGAVLVGGKRFKVSYQIDPVVTL
jgi:hypothetical protein